MSLVKILGIGWVVVSGMVAMAEPVQVCHGVVGSCHGPDDCSVDQVCEWVDSGTTPSYSEPTQVCHYESSTSCYPEEGCRPVLVCQPAGSGSVAP
jgi:hypothetical protein